MKLHTKPIDRINMRLCMAHMYLGAVGWTRGTRGVNGSQTDLVGALLYCAERDGSEIVAARMLSDMGQDTAWNDLVCANIFEAKQALDQTFANDDVERVYGENWYGVVGLLKLLTCATPDTLRTLAAHIGPADEACIMFALEKVGDSPAFEDAHLAISDDGYNRSVWLLADALMANVLMFPMIDGALADVLAPVAVKLGLA